MTWISWYEWQARELNRIFGRGSQIKAETIRGGVRAESRTSEAARGFTKDQLRRKSKRRWKGLAA